MSRAISRVKQLKRATQGKVADQLKIMNESLTARFSALETSITKMGGKIDAMASMITDMNTSITEAYRTIGDGR